ncbi:MAG: TRAM domain-containing protein [Trueperaceae bacterium]|nr:TRAM domain-containing protein [Trueperaceae bacterium]
MNSSERREERPTRSGAAPDASAGRSGAPSLSTIVIRLGLAGAGATIASGVAAALLTRGWLTGPNTFTYVTILGLLLGYLLSAPLADRWGERLDALLRRIGNVPPDVVLAAGTGATLALLVTVLINNVLAAVPGFTWFWSLVIAIVLVSASSAFFVKHRRLFAVDRALRASRDASTTDRPQDKVVDTSAIIDGRIVDVLDANFLDGTIVIPQFVLAELQRIADSDEPLRRKRGRRGLEVLDRLVAQAHVRTEVVTVDPGPGAVDDKLIALCQLRDAALVTTDFNLNRVAALQGVRVLNVNQLANAMRAMFLPGERLSLTVVREGREAGQGLAYLEDGTMVVIEDAAEIVGRTVDVVVTSSLQTNMGRMIFARVADG